MGINATQVTREAIAYTMATDKESLVRLLKRNGVTIAENANDKQIIVAVLMASGKSSTFKTELASLLAKKVPEGGKMYANFAGGKDFGFTGLDDFMFTGNDDFMNLTSFGVLPNSLNVPAAQALQSGATQEQASSYALSPQATSGSGGKVGNALGSVWNFLKSSVLTPENINQGLQIGLTSINNKMQAKSNNLQYEAANIAAAQNQIQNDIPNKPTVDNTTKYVLIGVGVIALGVIIFMVAKKMKK